MSSSSLPNESFQNDSILYDAGINDMIHLSISDDSYEVDPHHQTEDNIDDINNPSQVSDKCMLS